MSVARAKQPLLMETCKAAGVILADRFINGPKLAATQSVAGDEAIGVAESAAAVGEYFSAVSAGVTIVEAGAAVVDGAYVESDSVGRAITATTGSVLGRARTAATAAGQLIQVALVPVPLAP